MSLGTYPDVPIALAQARHRAARRMLAAGMDPSLHRRELRRTEVRDGALVGELRRTRDSCRMTGYTTRLIDSVA
ncbi:MAG: integrase arm-type DNA-binding domain-containing protein [Cyanobium sp.]